MSPVSQPSSIQNSVAAVWSSRARIVQGIAARPLNAGRGAGMKTDQPDCRYVAEAFVAKLGPADHQYDVRFHGFKHLAGVVVIDVSREMHVTARAARHCGKVREIRVAVCRLGRKRDDQIGRQPMCAKCRKGPS